MDDEPKQVHVKYKDVAYPINIELTERERFEAERMTRQSIDAMGLYTQGLCVAYFTLRRAGIDMTFDEFLDTSGFEIVQEAGEESDAPFQAAAADGEDRGGEATENGGSQDTPTSSGSTPG